MKITVDTDYPFKGAVRMLVTSTKAVRFPLYLRVPRWSEGVAVSINGRKMPITPSPGEYVRLERLWSVGDRVDITMPMAVSLTRWPRTGAVTVDRGPLSYSVKIGERWQKCGGTEAWPEWEVLPTGPWNYGLALSGADPTRGFVVTERPRIEQQPWTVEAAPIEIKARARKISNWTLENETVAELQVSPIRSAEPEEEITLIPLGCARLRMSCLPVIGEGSGARDWQRFPRIRRK